MDITATESSGFPFLFPFFSSRAVKRLPGHPI